MRRHVKTIHKDKKDFICGSCGKSFTQASYLRLHIKTLHEGHNFLPNLRGHIKTIHERLQMWLL